MILDNYKKAKGATYQSDIVIVGGGAAGLAAALQARENGGDVIVVEKRHTVGGNSAMAHGFFAADSPVQKRMNVSVPRDDVFKFAMDFHHWAINPRLVRAYIDKSGDTVRWLEEKGLKIARLGSVNPKYSFATFHMTEKATGNTVIKLLEQHCEQLGVKFLFGSRAKTLIRDSRGRIAGLIVQTTKGDARINTRTVIIASGGYGGNNKLLKTTCPKYSTEMVYLGLKELTGDGLLMAQDAGAATEGLGMPHYWGPQFSGTYQLNLVNQRPEMLWVNKNGERYFDESQMMDMGIRGNVLERQPDMVSYTIFDENIKQGLISEGLVGRQVALRWAPPDITWKTVLDQMPVEETRGNVKIADSLEEIAKWIGASPEVLKSTMDEYNADCAKGYDSMLLKDGKYLKPLLKPPYYAVKSNQALLDTMGGIKTTHCMEVVDKDNQQIPGLFAAGVCAGGYQSPTYCYALTGTMFGFALNSGRIAADSAQKYINRK